MCHYSDKDWKECGPNNIIAVALVHTACTSCTVLRPDHISNLVYIHVVGCQCVPAHSTIDQETVDGSNMDEHLESSWCLVYYRVSGDPRITVVIDQTFIPGNVDLCAQAYSLFIAA